MMMVQKLFADATMALEDLHSVAVEGQRRDNAPDMQLALATHLRAGIVGLIPIGERALAWIGKYQGDVRPDLANGLDDGTLFLTTLGEAFAPNRMTQLVRAHVEAADIGKRGSCHLFRHTMATLMLEGGADIRFIQAMLGHAELSTTQIYTQVSIRMLKQIHSATHPGRPIVAGTRDHGQDDDRDTLLATLDAEADEEE